MPVILDHRRPELDEPGHLFVAGAVTWLEIDVGAVLHGARFRDRDGKHRRAAGPREARRDEPSGSSSEKTFHPSASAQNRARAGASVQSTVKFRRVLAMPGR